MPAVIAIVVWVLMCTAILMLFASVVYKDEDEEGDRQ